EFYCGRCMRFLDETCFNESQRAKAKSGDGGYCLDCASSTLVTDLDIENVTIVRSTIPSPYMLSKRDQVRDQVSAQSTSTTRELTKIKNTETEEMLAWRR